MSNKHEANVRKSTLVNFQIGLIASLLFTYLMFEVYTAVPVITVEPPIVDNYDDSVFTIGEVEIEKVAKKELAVKKTEPVISPTEFIEKDDDAELKEFEKEFVNEKSTSSSPAPSVESIGDTESDGEVIHFDFKKVESVPIFPGCETLETNGEKAACFSKEIRRIVSKKFNTGLGERYGLTGIQRIYTVFEVSTDGTIQNIRVRAPHSKLEEEAQRVIELFPQMTPGKQRGTPVIVKYQLPITFRIQE